MDTSDLKTLLAIRQNLIKQIETRKKISHPKLLKKLEKHLRNIQSKIDSIKTQ